MLYLPDKVKLESVDRDLLFTIIHDADEPLYKELSRIAIEQEDYKNAKLFNDYAIELEDEFKNAFNKLPLLKGNIYLN